MKKIIFALIVVCFIACRKNSEKIIITSDSTAVDSLNKDSLIIDSAKIDTTAKLSAKF